MRAKSAGAPVADVRLTTALVKVTAVLALLVRVTACDAVAAPCAVATKVSIVGDTLMGEVTLPVSAIVCGLLVSLSTMVRVAVSVPVVEGV